MQAAASGWEDTARTTVLAEVAFVEGDRLDGAVLVPLVDDGDVVFALPYADRALADRLAASPAVAVVCSDRRGALGRWHPLAATGRVAVEADPDGRRFAGGLIGELLRKHPPSRVYGDSLMSRREHWWWMARLLCRFEAAAVTEVAARDGPADGVLAWLGGDGLGADTVRVVAERDDRVWVSSLAGGVIAGTADPACLVRHDASLPDLEEQACSVVAGRLESDALRVVERRGDHTLPPPASLVRRVRARRAFSRECRRELAASRRA